MYLLYTTNVYGQYLFCKLRYLSHFIFFIITTKKHIISVSKTHKADLFKNGVSYIGLFVAFLRNEQSLQSDIDFEPGKENFDNYIAVYDFFETLFKNEKVDIVTKNGLSKYIGPKILSEVLYV